MCGGGRYIAESGKDWKIYFPNPKAALPVRMLISKVEWFKWGRCKEEINVPSLGFMIVGPRTVALASLQPQRWTDWDGYEPEAI